MATKVPDKDESDIPKSWGPVIKEESPHGSSWNEVRSFHPTDIKLREHGFRIEHRHPGKEPIWSLGREHYGQSDALALIAAKEVPVE